ncbi:MAG: carbohydrate ABC transporter permease [Thermomicrobiales bacterium]
MKHERSRLADSIIHATLILFGLLCLLPLLHVLNVSLSSPRQLQAQSLLLWPHGFTLDSYRFIFQGKALPRAFGVTLFITVVGTALNLLLTTTAAYVLSRRELPGAGAIMVFIVIAMVFNAGIVPGYITVRNLHLIDSLWSMILPGMVNAFYLILMRNFFWNVPESLVEAARLDGASELTIFARIMLPLSLPALATLGLFYAVVHWNEFFRGIFYINDPAKWPLQVLLRGIVVQADLNELGGSTSARLGTGTVNQITIQAASIIAAMAPIALVYPFIQKYFVKGIQLGAEKG